ncbi:MAG: sigma factor, partial [Myxococcota bacterium]
MGGREPRTIFTPVRGTRVLATRATNRGPEEIQDIDRRLRGLARRLVGDENHASDLVQDAWLSALTKEGGPIRRLGAWLSVAV